MKMDLFSSLRPWKQEQHCFGDTWTGGGIKVSTAAGRGHPGQFH